LGLAIRFRQSPKSEGIAGYSDTCYAGAWVMELRKSFDAKELRSQGWHVCYQELLP